MKHRVVTLLLAAVLAGCGGGLYIGIDGFDDNPPSVSLVADTTSAAPGERVRLAAAASDDDFVVEVRFYRIDPDGRTFYLGRDERPPWDWDAEVPLDAVRGSVVRFFARAVDSIDQSRDSARLEVLVR